MVAGAEAEIDPQVGAKGPPHPWRKLWTLVRHDVLWEAIGAENMVKQHCCSFHSCWKALEGHQVTHLEELIDGHQDSVETRVDQGS